MDTEFDALNAWVLPLAGRSIVRPYDRIRRYCGLRWSGGGPETWAYRYYDAITTPADEVVPVDVVATAALHPGISRSDLGWFHDHTSDLNDWLRGIPTGEDEARLARADAGLLDHLALLVDLPDVPSIALLSKVLHRKRPDLIPLIDRHIVDWYRPVTGERSAKLAWRPFLGAMQQDLTLETLIFLTSFARSLELEGCRRLSHLRLIDIAVWMEGNE